MSRAKGMAAAVLLGAGFVAGVLYLFGVQFAAGDVYPEYSSLRSDPAGSRLLFDALARLAGVTAVRNYIPLDAVTESSAALLLLGMEADSFTDDSGLHLRLERLAERGNRIILAMARPPEGKAPKTGSLYRWEVKIGVDREGRHVHRLYFAAAKGWRVLEQVRGKVLAIERGFGKGSVVLLAESDDFANASTVAADRLETVAAAIGPYTRVVFDEQHFGISETGSIVGLARRFRLTGMALGLAICAALFLWRSASAFPPPVSARAADRLSGRTSQAGLLTLLRRHVPASEVAAAAWQEWMSANRRSVPADRLRRAAEIARTASDRPVEALREIETVLHSKGEL